MHKNIINTPRVLFDNARAMIGHDFQVLADQFDHVLENGEFDSSAKDRFFFKGSLFAIGGIVFNHSFNTHLIANAELNQHGLSFILSGESKVTCKAERKSELKYDALLSPPGAELLFETSLERLTSSLHITFDLDRLKQVSSTMQGGKATAIGDDHLKKLDAFPRGMDLRRLFTKLVTQIDDFAGDSLLLQAAGFDDQAYRLLAITLQPEVFFKDALSIPERRASSSPSTLAGFGRYVEERIREPVRLTEIEASLDISARALQYACLKHYGCSPREYIRNKKLDHAYERILHQQGDIKLADLAAELHFSSQSQFARYFRERFGIRPSEMI